MNSVQKHSKKVAIGIIGGTVTLVGLVLVPYPGPGWLVVFAGLAVLSTEFEFASRLLAFARGKYDAWAQWLSAQNWTIRIASVAMTCVVVLATLWLVNAFGITAALAGIDIPWLTSPFFR